MANFKWQIKSKAPKVMLNLFQHLIKDRLLKDPESSSG
jgi:hypothetical protein